MSIKLPCSNCGRTLTAPEGDAGLTAMCVACGARMVVPAPPPLIAPVVGSFLAVALPATDGAVEAAPAPQGTPASWLWPTPGEAFLPAGGRAAGAYRPEESPEAAPVPGTAPFTEAGGPAEPGLLRTPAQVPPSIAAPPPSLVVAFPEGVPLPVAARPRMPASVQWSMRVGFIVCLIGAWAFAIWAGAPRRPAGRDGDVAVAVARKAPPAEGGDKARKPAGGDKPVRPHVTPPPAAKPPTPASPGVIPAADLPVSVQAFMLRSVPSPKSFKPAGSVAARPPEPARPRPEVKPPPQPEPPAARRRPMPAETEGVTDEKIGRAIERGVARLESLFDNNGNLLVHDGYGSGAQILAVYALLQSGQALKDERLDVHNAYMRKLVEAMKVLDLNNQHETYSRGLRASALALYNRKEDQAVLKGDVQWLMAATKGGGYTYREQKEPTRWDNSNSQYGLLGVWAGAEAGVEVPNSYWTKVQNHWFETQVESGEWGYGYNGFSGRDGRLSMTLAGIASLFVTHDYLDAARFGSAVGRPPFNPALAKGLAWLEQGDHSIRVDGGWWGYTLYGVERVGLASGFKFFGAHDWYRELARDVILRQAQDGSWGGTVNTSYALLFLSRGRHPVMMNKLRFDRADGAGGRPADSAGVYWANRPRDLANLARFATHTLERPINWQVVSLEKEWTDWTDSSILYIASHEPPNVGDGDVDKIRSFVEAGGMLYTQADGGSEKFDKFAHDLAKKLFPDYEIKPLPDDHYVYNLVYPVNPKPLLLGVSNGSRLLMIHSPNDLAMHWQLRAEKSKENLFQFGVNMFIYAAGKTDLRNRLASTYLRPLPAAAETIKVARLRYPGGWDPEPAAWPRFARWFQRQTSVGLNVVTSDLADLKPQTAPVAHLTGAFRYAPTEGEAAALRQYVESGGVLLIDSCGGAWQFTESARAGFIGRAFPDKTLLPLERSHPMLTSGPAGMDDLAKPRLRPYTVTKLGRNLGHLDGFAFGKGHVIFSELDLVSGLLGSQTWGVLGLDPLYAQALAKNVILWTVDGQKDEPAP